MEIRKALETERDAWVRLRHELWPDCPKERHDLEISQILGSDGVVAVALDGAAMVGFAEVSLRSDHVEGAAESPVPYLEGWYVVPVHRGKGIGRSLITFIEDWALSQGYTELASDAELHNEGSLRAHEKLGFQEVGRSVQFIRMLKS